MNKNSTNLIYANQLKTRICRSIISVIQKQKHNIMQKAEKHDALGVHSLLNYTMAELIDVFRKKKQQKNCMTPTLKLFCKSSDSTKMTLLL